MAKQNIEDMVSQVYTDFKNLGKKKGYFLKRSYNRENYGYAEIAPTPTYTKKGRLRWSNYASRTNIFNNIIANYLNSGVDDISRKDYPNLTTRIYNNPFRSKIKLESKDVTLYIWVPKFSWLFGNRVKMRYVIKDPSIKGEGFNIFRKIA
jgi:hypothetical protein